MILYVITIQPFEKLPFYKQFLLVPKQEFGNKQLKDSFS